MDTLIILWGWRLDFKAGLLKLGVSSQEKSVRSAPEKEKLWAFECEGLGEWKDAREGGEGRDVRVKTFNGDFKVNCHVLCDKLILMPQ